jgi:ABC-2 type transport system permease protein
MNIFAYETRSQLKNFIVWTATILLIFYLFVSALYGVFVESREAVEKTYNGFPPAFAKAFGILIDQIFTYGGFFQFVFTYIALMGAIMASSLGLSVFSREKRSKCVDFLLTKPVSRGRIFILKLLSCLMLIVILNVLFVLISLYGYKGSNAEPIENGRLIWASSALFFTQLVFLSLGMLYAVYVRKVRAVSGIATGFGFAGFILMALVSILREENLRFISPLSYFTPSAVFTAGGYETKYAVTAAVVVAACFILSYLRYCRADTPAL